VRSSVKRGLALASGRRPAGGATLLTYHRVGAGTADELDTPTDQLAGQLDVLVRDGHDVVDLDVALGRLAAGDARPSVVLTFDDGFADVHTHAFPLLRERGLPFTVYVTAGLIGGEMRWEGSRAESQGAPAMDWDQLAELASSGLCTIGNHTFSHVEPHRLDERELDRCSDALEERLAVRPEHFAWTWGVEVPRMLDAIAARFRSAATGRIGRNPPGTDPLSLARVPVRRTDPRAFFEAKLRGGLLAERTYDRAARLAKRVRSRG
jgi:peptidoglycan/xylan/chitin deacetylase (PgdA/CDA1 family)